MKESTNKDLKWLKGVLARSFAKANENFFGDQTISLKEAFNEFKGLKLKDYLLLPINIPFQTLKDLGTKKEWKKIGIGLAIPIPLAGAVGYAVYRVVKYLDSKKTSHDNPKYGPEA